MRRRGIGLFASTVEGMSPRLRPVDVTIVYAGENTRLIGPDGQLAPVWPGAAPRRLAPPRDRHHLGPVVPRPPPAFWESLAVY